MNATKIRIVAWAAAGAVAALYSAAVIRGSASAAAAGVGSLLVLGAGLSLPIAAALCVSRTAARDRPPWIALLATGCAATLGGVLELFGPAAGRAGLPVGTASILYLVSYAGMFAAVASLARTQTSGRWVKVRSALDVVALAAALGAMEYLLLRDALVANARNVASAESALALTFTILDFLLLMTVAAIALNTRGVPWRKWELLLVAAVAGTGAIDALHTRALLAGEHANISILLQGLGTVVPSLLATLAAVHFLTGDDERAAPPCPRSVVGATATDYVVPGVAIATIPLLAWQSFAGTSTSSVEVSVVAVMALALTLTLRSAVLSHENSLLLRATLTDPLTGLYNVRMHRERLSEAIVFAKRTLTPLSVASIDIDEFAAINNVHGHDVGDECLRHVAAAIGRSVRGSDVACRVGGDEFCLIMPDTSTEDAMGVCSRFSASLASQVSPCGEPIHISVGIAAYSPDSADSESLMRRADGAMYWVKYHGRRGVLVYDPVLVGQFDRRSPVGLAEAGAVTA